MTSPRPPASTLQAHSANDAGLWHGLPEHLSKVGALAASLAAAFHGDAWAAWAGRWHDLGKARPGFQSYLRFNSDAHIEGRVAGAEKTHSAAGALHARTQFIAACGPDAGGLMARVLEYLIAGHHSGLADWNASESGQGLAPRLSSAEAQTEYQEALAVAQQAMPELCVGPTAQELTQAAMSATCLRDPSLPLARSLWLRMLFSALVDADFLDTEAHFKTQPSRARGQFPPLTRYREQLDAHVRGMGARVEAEGRAASPVMAARAAVLAQCRAKAALPPGVFSLGVPTGGGKTLSSLAFALEHACQHGLRRVVYAIPYTSIIEQTAGVFASIFGSENLVEHHSQAEADSRQETAASRLACENWDAPLIVTTNVQLLESLFADRSSRCRKLHRLAGSVIILDEAQMLPPEFLQPILDALNALLRHFGITLLLCTATQPVLTDLEAYDSRRRLRGLPAPTAIIDEPAQLYAQLRRTEVLWPERLDHAIAWPDLLPQLLAQPSALVIVNTRRAAYELTRALPENTRHLSAAMCGAHRQSVIARIKQALIMRRDHPELPPVRVVATPLVECGVDIDLPVVYRQFAGLDSIAQAAGRCNREGRLQQPGQVHVFVRPIPKLLAQLRSAAETTRSLLEQGLTDALAPEAFERYFSLFYQRQDSFDARQVLPDLEDRDQALKFNFRSAARKFRLIDDEDQVSLLVPYQRIDASHGHLEALIASLSRGDTDRWLMRAIQRYTVSIRKRELETLERRGDVRPLLPGLYLLTDETIYDPVFGLLPRDSPLDAASLVQ